MLSTLSAPLEGRTIVLRTRAYVFVSIVIMGLVWTGLLSAVSFVKGRFRSGGESAATITFLAAQVISALYIPIFALADSSDHVGSSRWYSHTWFELLSLYFLFAFQFSGSLVYTLLSPSFNCTEDSADREGECQLVNAYISIASWLTPVAIIIYMTYITAVCIRRSKVFRAIWRTPMRLVPWDNGDLGASMLSKTSASSSYNGSKLEGEAPLFSRFSSSTKFESTSSRLFFSVPPQDLTSLPTKERIPSFTPKLPQPRVSLPRDSFQLGPRANHASQSTLGSVYSVPSYVYSSRRI